MYAKALRRIARLWALLSLLLLLVFLVGEGGPPPSRLRDWLGLLFFPVGVAAGLLLTWWRERLGGAVAMASLVAFYVVLYLFDGRFPRGPYFFLVAAPGLLFLLLPQQEGSGGT